MGVREVTGMTKVGRGGGEGGGGGGGRRGGGRGYFNKGKSLQDNVHSADVRIE